MGEFVDGYYYSKNLNLKSLWDQEINVGPDHLSQINTREEPTGVKDDLPNAHLFRIEAVPSELEEISQFLENGQAPEGMSTKKKNKS